MTRHGKNATASSVYSYHERQKDLNQSEYGTQSARAGKDSIKDFDACCLTLQTCKEPMISPQGMIYDKEAILQYIVQQKAKIAKQKKAYEKQKIKEKKELKELSQSEQKELLDKFVKNQDAANQLYKKKKEESKSSSTSKDLSFWTPSHTPKAEKSKVKKPSSKVFCPMTNKPIKFKDLVPVKFTPVADRNTTTSVIAKKARWQCAVTHDVLHNSTSCAVLKTTGDVVTMDCVNKIIRKSGMKHPLTGDELFEEDIIEISRGGTGFSTTNESLEAKSYRPVMVIS